MKKVRKTVQDLLGPREQFLLNTESEDFKFLGGLENSFSPSGHEEDAQQVLKEFIIKNTSGTYSQISPYQDILVMLNPDAKRRIGLSAHADKIGYIVLKIEENGMIRVKKLGGSNPQIAVGQWAQIRGSKGLVSGIFGWPAIHVIMKMEKQPFEPNEKRLTLDCGFSSKKEAVDAGIFEGCPIMVESELRILNNRYLVGIHDDAIGVFMIAQALRMAEALGIDVGIGLLVSSQEEIGLKGATRFGHYQQKIGFNSVLFTDVCHDTTGPHTDEEIHGHIDGDHIAIAVGPSVSRKFGQIVFDVAEKAGLGPQRYAASTTLFPTGTDMDALADQGVNVALLSVPVRYMHSGIERTLAAMIYDGILAMVATIVHFSENED